MNMILLLIPILMWSFVGVLVKEAAFCFTPPIISFFRFFFGFAFLALWMAVTRKKPRIDFGNSWIWIAAAAKAINYMAENQALTHGASWGYIVEQPVQAVAFLLISLLFLREKPGFRKTAAALLCVAGAALIGVKGIAQARVGGAIDVALFTLAAFGGSIHMAGQKVLMGKMDSLSMNLGVFLVSSCITALTLPFSGNPLTGAPTVSALGAAIALGFITGASFLIWGVALSRVSFLASGISSNALVVFALLWGILLRDEWPDAWSLWGTAIFIVGLIAMNAPAGRKVKAG